MGEQALECPDCGNPLQLLWHGLPACFCLWGGKEPTADQIVESATPPAPGKER